MNRARMWVTARETGIDFFFACGVCAIAAIIIELGTPIWAVAVGLLVVVAVCHWNDFDADTDIPSDKDNFPGGPPAAA